MRSGLARRFRFELTYQRKIAIALCLAVGSFIPLIATSLFTVHKLISDQSAIIEVNARQTLLVERLQFYNAARARQVPEYILTRDPAQLAGFYEYHRLFNLVLQQVLSLENDEDDQVLLRKLKRDSDLAYSFVKPGLQLLSNGKSIESVDRYFRTTTGELAKEISATARQLAQSAASHENEARTEMNRTVAKLESAIVTLALLALFLVALATYLIGKVLYQKRTADEQGARISQARKEVVEVVAHDLKSPIAVILMTVDLLRQGFVRNMKTFDLQTGIDMISRSAKSANQLITDLLDHAKIESGNLMIEAKPHSLRGVTEAVGARFELLARAKSIEFTTVLGDEDLVSLNDPARIDQVLSNLLSNAIKFTPEGGKIVLTCHKVRGRAQLSVEDTGPGLNHEQCALIFNRYWQVRKSDQQGSGLGLAIAKAIVEAHQGSIWIESLEGQGSTFFVSLPL